MPERRRPARRGPQVVALARVVPMMDTIVETEPASDLAMDSVTGLPTLSHLVEVIQDLQEKARAAMGPRRASLAEKVLVVVSIEGGDDRHGTLFLRARTASVLRALFTDDETIVLLRQGLFGVLARDRPELAADRSFLESMLAEFDVRARIWTERVPADGPGTANLLSALLLGGDWSDSAR